MKISCKWSCTTCYWISGIIIKNTDAANFITVTWDNLAAGGSRAQVVPAKRMFILPTFNPPTDISIAADTAAVIVIIAVTANNG